MTATAARTELLWRPGDAPAGLYVHVPFCRSLCSYCAFAKEVFDPSRAAAWIEGVEREADRRAAASWQGRPRLDTVFVGGGTPTTLPEPVWRRLRRLLDRVFDPAPDLEFTVEANPESFQGAVPGLLRELGVNRVSLGAQSFEAAELDRLRRAHDAGAVERAVRAARDAGFDNVNLDLMYGLPGRSAGAFRRSLERALALEPEHLSAYCLGLEPGTDLARDVAAGAVPAPDDDAAREEYDLLVKTAAAAGFEPYEISNFARSGRECLHNLRYWTRRDFFALGPSAHALAGGRRWANPAPLDRWLAAYREGAGPEPRPVPEAEARFEWVFLNLRLMRGLDVRDYEREWGEGFDARYGAVADRLIARGLLERDGPRLRLPRRAWFLSDGVFAEFAP